MPPKKSKAIQSSSQPVADAPKPKRAIGRKRRHSDASNISDRPGSVQSTAGADASTAVKRRKKGKQTPSVEPEIVVEEDEQNVGMAAINEVPDREAQLQDQSEDRNLQESIEVSQYGARHVHFGSDAAIDDYATAATTTPHPRKKMTIKRRVTLSPTSSMRVKSALPRSSLPPSMSQETSGHKDAAMIVQELQFAPLRAVLDERVRRRLRRSHLSEEQNEIEDHARRDSRTQQELEELRVETQEKQRRIDELAYELEAQRQASIDVSDVDIEEQMAAVEMERELKELRQELANHMATHGLNGDMDVDAPDDHMLVLDSQEEFAYPHLPAAESNQTLTQITNGRSSIRDAKTTTHDFSELTPGRTSLGASVHAAWEAERRQFEDHILALSTEANNANTTLRVLQIELQNLGFGDGEVEPRIILQSIRESFARVREELELNLPDTVPEDASTQDIMEILIANVKEFADRLRSQEQELHEKNVLIADLGNQVQGLLTHLADAEIRLSKLDKQWRDLDEQNEEKTRSMEDIEEELIAAEDERDRLQDELNAKVEETKSMGADHAQSIKNIEKLQMSLESYRNEETRLTELITRMENEHRDDITKMNKEREETIQDLEEKLDAETDFRRQAEEKSEEKTITLEQLELRVEEVATERDVLRETLDLAKAELQAERDSRETAEADLEEKIVQTEDLETRVSRLEEQLVELNAELDELRQSNDDLRKHGEQERHQRELAETELDAREVKLDELGKQANELRLKLFEVQQKNAEKVKELETLASERDEQFQTDIAEEVQRREVADRLVQQHAATIEDLEARIEDIQDQMRDAILLRDERIAALEEDLAQKTGEIEGLKLDLQSTENTLDINRTEWEDRAEELNNSILALQETIASHEETIKAMQKEAANTMDMHNSEIDDRDAQVAVLHGNVADLQARLDDLETEKAGLERRVEAEAEQMLQLQNEKEDELDALRLTIQDKQAKILVVEEKAREADSSWQEVLQARDEEIEQLKTTTTSHEEAYTTLTEDYTSMQSKFRDFVRRATSAIDRLQAAVDTAKTVADDEGDMLKMEGDALMGEIEAMDAVGAMQVKRSVTRTTTTTAQTPQTSGSSAKKGRGRKKRVQDSGIGLDGEEAEEPMAA